jgi:hypothetical protein
MRQRRNIIMGGIVSLVAILAVVGDVFLNSPGAAAQSQPSEVSHAQRVVNTYLETVNAGMATPQCEFAKLSTVLTPNADLILTGGPFAPGGPFGPGGSFGEQQVLGVSAIIGAYAKLCHILYSKGAGAPSWTQDAGFLLAPNVLNSYEHVSLGGHFTGRCMHVFTVSDNRVSSLDWSVYA